MPIPGNEQDLHVRNLEMLVRQMARLLPDTDKTKQQALDYLVRHCSATSILRGNQTREGA